MSFFSKFQAGLEKVVNPFADWISRNRFIKALTQGFMCTMPITIGTAALAILGNLPVGPWQDFINSTGLYQVLLDVASVTISLMAVYIVSAIAYNFANNEGESGMIGALMAFGTFLILAPIQTPEVDGVATSMLSLDHLGSNGVFPAMLCGLLVPYFYCKLMKKNLKLKLPSSVPPMVSDSLSPTFVAMIIFTTVFFIKYLFTLTPYGDAFSAVSEIIAQPIMMFGASPWSLIAVYTLCNVCWFFGIHPSPLINAYMPVIMACGMANGAAYTAGKPLPYVVFMVTYLLVYMGGTGNTLGLCVATLFAKSEKYKAMRKLVIPANIFNINEPIIFGFPIMLNPIYFVPMVLASIGPGIISLIFANIFPIQLNPTVILPWVTPGFVQAFLQGGIWVLVIWLIGFAVNIITYFPFFMIDDKRAYNEEQANLVNQE